LPDVDIDYATSMRSAVTSHLQQWFEGFGSILTGIATFGTEKPKSALITATRGLAEELNLAPEDGLYFASLVPSERGFLLPLHDCYYGDEEKGRKPIPEFVQAMNENPKVWEVAQEIEGLINEMGSHPAGIAIFEQDKVYSQCALMKTPGGLFVTQFDLSDAEVTGVTKYDLLTTDAIDAQQTEIYLLAEQGYIDWLGNLKETYNSILHPKNLNYTEKEMWEKSHRKEIISWFQFDTPVGEVAIETVRPTDLNELATLNSVMRLMAADGAEMPLVQYRHRKENLSIWYAEMRHAGLSDEEIKVLEKHMLITKGMCITQEQLMLMLQDPKIANFSYMESDYARKVVAKKKMKEIESLKDKVYKKGIESGNSQRLLDYVWFNAFAIQMGYSFSIIHTVSYSIIAIQQLNLIQYYPPIFWATARLMVESKSVELLDEDLDLLESDDAEEEESDKKAKGVNYFKMSSALNKIKAYGIKIQPPDINTSSFTFFPNVAEDRIYFGLKGITRISNSTIQEIMENRPYNGLLDFLSKVKVNAIQATMLIKAGAFDAFQDRYELVCDYAKSRVSKKARITLQNFNQLIELNLLPDSLELEQKIFRLTKHLKKHFLYGDIIILEDMFVSYAEQVGFDKIYHDQESGFYAKLKEWETFYKKAMEKAKPWLKSNEQQLIDQIYALEIQEIVDKYWQGNQSYGEMEAISFYHSKHEFAYPEYDEWLDRLGIVDFFSLPEEPVSQSEVYKMFQLSAIAGVCIGRDKSKKIVGLLTKDGFVKIKVHRAQFVKYDKQIKQDGQTEKSWFSKGSKIIVYGYRNGDYFYPKAYKNSKHKQALLKIIEPGVIQKYRLGEE